MEDPRCNIRNQVYTLQEILFLVISTVVSEIDTWKGVSLFGKNKLDWLRQYFDFKNGVSIQRRITRDLVRNCPAVIIKI